MVSSETCHFPEKSDAYTELQVATPQKAEDIPSLILFIYLLIVKFKYVFVKKCVYIYR